MIVRAEPYIHYGNEPLESAYADHSTIELMSSGDGTEVVRWAIEKGGWISLVPADDFDGSEFFYIIHGHLRGDMEDKSIDLMAGSILSVSKLKQALVFEAETDTVLLYVTSQPVFHYLSQQSRELMDLAVQVEERDEYTAGHCRRLQELSARVGQHLDLTPDAMYRLLFGAFLHDVGKTHIPDNILNKPGPLTDDEWEVMKEHPRLGRELVEETILREVGPVIEQHHERLDGSGYPHGLRGDEIMVEAQIIGVVDSYDAMTTDRPYRKALPKEWALGELRKGAGTLYSPRVVEALEAVLEETEMDETA